MQKGALPGFRDFYPEDLALRAHIFEVWRRVATRYGFEEYDGPPLEPLDLYTAKSGDEIVGQLYNFTDKGDRAVSLRPEMTPTLARMVAARANGLKKPIRWFSMPQLFRYERQQRGRLREHFQLNCDLIGEAGPLADAEVIALAIDTMKAFDLKSSDVKVRLSDRRVITALLRNAGVTEAQLPEVFQVMDRWYKVTDGAVTEMLQKAGLETNVIQNVRELAGIDRLRDIKDRLRGNTEQFAAFSQVHEALEAMGLEEFVEIDLTIVRGLAYYTGTVFELFEMNLGRPTGRAICGGGRYDSLTGAVGGVELPAVGFGMGDVVLRDLLEAKKLLPTYAGSVDVFVAIEAPESMAAALKLTHELRDAGIRAEYALGAQTISKQQDIAKARNASCLATIGAKDVQLKDLLTKDTHVATLGDAVARIRAMLPLVTND